MRLFYDISSLKNLKDSYRQAQHGKRYYADVAQLDYHLASALTRLQRELRSGAYRPRPYRYFVLQEYKKRQIAAPAFRDRIVQHALCSYLGPLYEKRFIPDSYACRPRRGIHRAATRIQHFLRTPGSQYACKIDVSKYYASVNHQLLYALLQKRILDPQLLHVLQQIIDSFESGATYDHLFLADSYYHTKGPRGIPIGNLTSQLFANIYLHELDMYVKQKLKIRYYARYMDDILFFGVNKAEVTARKDAITRYLYERLYLTAHPKKTRIYPSCNGVDFVGFVIYPHRIRLRASTVRAFRHRYRHTLAAVARGTLEPEKAASSLASWKAHASFAHATGLIKQFEAMKPPPPIQLHFPFLDEYLVIPEAQRSQRTPRGAKK